jgi:hypothetical protein
MYQRMCTVPPRRPDVPAACTAKAKTNSGAFMDEIKVAAHRIYAKS